LLPAGRYALFWMLSRSPAYPTGFIEPRLPTPSRVVPDGSRWAFELKHDGYRFITRREGDHVRVFSRNARDWTDRVPLIVEAIRALPVNSATLDGEGVICDDRGVTDFERLRTALAARGGSRSVFLFGFDLLELHGEDLHRHPWEIRRATLTRLLRKAGPGIRLSEHLDGDGEAIFRHACALGAEGIVAKRRDRPYRSGRSPDWVKVKNLDAPAAKCIME
jgi:bifunctional non-homologous end joining protein LigD